MPTKPAQLRAEGHSALGEVIVKDAKTIIDRWARRATEEQPSAKRVHHDALLDHLPTLLWELGRALGDVGGKNALQYHRPAMVHGDQRWEVGWSIEELVRDYQLLRIVVVQHLSDTLRRPLATRESMALNVFIDDAIVASVSAFQACESADATAPTGAAPDARLEEMLGVMGLLGHEIRNPLAPMQNAAQVLKLAGDDPERREWARLVIGRQLGVMTRLVEDLLDVPRLVRGKMQIKLERVDLARLVREAVEDRRTAFESAGLTLMAHIPPRSIWTSGDAARITQVVGNLLANALKFSDRDGTITVRLSVDNDRHIAVLSFTDTGIGIDPALLPHVFGAFVQGDRTVERTRGGLGLGLALVKGIVELHGGTVLAESQGLGTGSTFTIELPLIDRPKAAADNGKRKVRTASRRVLIVEDNRDAAESLKVCLELHGHQVIIAYSGFDGVALAQATSPDVVVLDIGLPGMSGYAACDEMRKNPALCDALFVSVSGHVAPESAEAAADGFDMHLLKPVDPVHLAQIIAEHQPLH